MRKRTIRAVSLLLSLLLLVSICPMGAFADDEPCAHDFQAELLVPATLDAPYSGYENLVCSKCGDLCVRTIVAKDEGYNVYFDRVIVPNEGDTIYPESLHPYENNTSDIQTISYPGAARLRFYFNSQSESEPARYDSLSIFAGDTVTDTPCYVLANKDYTAKTCYEVMGDTATFFLKTDSSAQKWGYAIDKVEAFFPSGTPEAVEDANNDLICIDFVRAELEATIDEALLAFYEDIGNDVWTEETNNKLLAAKADYDHATETQQGVVDNIDYLLKAMETYDKVKQNKENKTIWEKFIDWLDSVADFINNFFKVFGMACSVA